MSYQTGEFPVSAGGRNVGSVTVSQNGLMTVFDSACEHTGPDVFRLAAVCGGRAVTLGVFIPDQAGTLRLKKSYSKNALAAIGFAAPESYHLARPDELSGDMRPALAPVRTPPPPAPEQDAAASGDKRAAPADNKTAVPAAVRPVRRQADPSRELRPVRPKPPEDQQMPPFMTPMSGPREAAEPQTQPESQTRTQPEPQTQPGNPEQPDIKVHPEIRMKPEAQAQPNIQAQPEVQAEAQPKTQAPSSADTEQAKPQEIPEQAEAGTRAETVPPEKPGAADGWFHADHPDTLFSDPDFADICRGVRDALTKQAGELTLLAVPVSPDEPFPMMPVFCLGDSGRIGGREYIVFKIKNGKLAL